MPIEPIETGHHRGELLVRKHPAFPQHHPGIGHKAAKDDSVDLPLLLCLEEGTQFLEFESGALSVLLGDFA